MRWDAPVDETWVWWGRAGWLDGEEFAKVQCILFGRTAGLWSGCVVSWRNYLNGAVQFSLNDSWICLFLSSLCHDHYLFCCVKSDGDCCILCLYCRCYWMISVSTWIKKRFVEHWCSTIFTRRKSPLHCRTEYTTIHVLSPQSYR